MLRVSSRRQAGFTLIEILVVVAVLLTLMAIAIPNMLRARSNANEASAVASLRTISTAQATYQQTYSLGFAPTLLALGPGGGGGAPTAAAADLIDQVLAAGSKTGYIFIYTPLDANGDGRMDSYTIQANPTVPGQTGNKYFFADHTSVIRFSMAGPATAASPPIPPQ
jgi:type IV pilus assembly protein PilA